MSVQIFEADWTWTGVRFERGVRVAVDSDGRICSAAEDERKAQELTGRALLPGFVNAHSHAFQRGLRARGERFPVGAGSFWTWREAMYGLVQQMTPERMGDLCRRAFDEMLAAGMTSVGEFHYLHHNDAAAQDHALDTVVLQAARGAGIRIVLLNAYYSSGGFDVQGGRVPVGMAQARFRTPSPREFWSAFDRLTPELDAATQSLGVVVHSLRAADAGELREIQSEARRRGLVLHIHLEEQRREVEECQRSHGMTPMALLLETLGQTAGDLDNVCAVHCTHTEAGDMARFLAAGGRVCLTPTTEASLGDGTPDLPGILKGRGALSLGSDSNTRISMFEEMRWAEYAQRLVREERGVARNDEEGHIAPTLLRAATVGGAAALGLPAGDLCEGSHADFLTIDLDHPILGGVDAEHLPEALALAGDERVIRDVFVGGRQIR
ncbi:MAG: formimidoylglutamate deiminase [Planctomycetota bacterium]